MEYISMSASQEYEEVQWLYRREGRVYGPISADELAIKLLDGRVPPDVYAAVEGTNDFHPITRFEAFRAPLEDLNETLTKRRGRIEALRWVLAIGFVTVCGLASAMMVGEAREELLQNRVEERNLELEARAKRDVELAGLRLSEPAVLVTEPMLEQAREQAKEREAKAKKEKAGKRAKKRSNKRASSGVSVVDSCKLEDRDVLRTLKRSLGKINWCIESEKGRNPGGPLPESLPVSFVVRPTGEIIQFRVEDADYRQSVLGKCLKKTFRKVRFPVRKGTDCPINLPIRIRK